MQEARGFRRGPFRFSTLELPMPTPVARHPLTPTRVAAANGASVTACSVDGLVATVSASRFLLGIPVVSTATAGPPPGEPD